MADWTTIPDANLQPGEPLTSELMLALRDNPAAIADGATGAPRVQIEALAAGVGVWRAVQEANITTAASTVDFIHATYGDPNLVAILFDIRFVQHANTNSYLGMRFSANGGSSFFATGYLNLLGHSSLPPEQALTDRIALSERNLGAGQGISGGRFYVQKNVGAAQRTRVSGSEITQRATSMGRYDAAGLGPLGQHPNAFRLLPSAGSFDNAFVRTYALIVA